MNYKCSRKYSVAQAWPSYDVLINKSNNGYWRNCISPCLDAEGFCDICNCFF